MTETNIDGRCVALSECSRFKKGFFTSEDFEWISRNTCPDSNKLVCCEAHTLLATEEECEVSNVYRVINGNVTAIDQYPFFALLVYEDPETHKLEFNCGGSLINPR